MFMDVNVCPFNIVLKYSPAAKFVRNLGGGFNALSREEQERTSKKCTSSDVQ